MISADALEVGEEGGRRQLNPYDPSQGYADEGDEEAPYDPWEAEAHSPGTDLLPGVLDIEALRRRRS